MRPGRPFAGRRVVILGTGFSVTPEQLALVNCCGLPVLACNLAFRYCSPALVYGTNWQFWRHYLETEHSASLRRYAYEGRCWTFDNGDEPERTEIIERWGINAVVGRWAPGFSRDPGVIHFGHGAGYEIINVALHAGPPSEIYLVGYDLRYPTGYDGIAQKCPNPRHFFGEYPPELRHWTKTGIGSRGELRGLLELYEQVNPADYGTRIINVTPASALTCFETGDIRELIQ